jgi:hypothetical protein
MKIIDKYINTWVEFFFATVSWISLAVVCSFPLIASSIAVWPIYSDIDVNKVMIKNNKLNKLSAINQRQIKVK